MSKPFAFFLLALVSFLGCARKNFYQKTALVNPPSSSQTTLTLPDSAIVTVGRQYKRSKFHNLFLGKHYRVLWATPVKLPVYKMEQEFGGLSPVSLGGGFQTTSLSLKAKNGRLYVLRSLDKDPVKTLPPALRNTFLVNMLRDQTSAANPFAPVVLPHLSEAAGIFYCTPHFFYVAENDSSFGKFSARILGKVMLLEEKFDGKEALTPMFGNAIDLVGSEILLKNRYEDSHHQIDQQLFARSRLFDILIGDWDRHEGQWQWAVYKNGSEYMYKPIPKDRDQAFYRFNDGVLTWLASKTPVLKKFQTFHYDYGSLSGWLFNARFIDARALCEVTREEWVLHAEEIKADLTDGVIEKAVANLPEPVYAKNGPEIIARLKSRRDKLPEAAAGIYKILAKKVTVAGTDANEKFVVNRLPTGETLVEVFHENEAVENTKPIYVRTFKPSETREITLHGLGGNDMFCIYGEVRKTIPLKIYGGEGVDELQNKSKVKGWGKTISVYDTKRGLVMEPSKEVSNKRSHHVSVNAYDREGL